LQRKRNNQVRDYMGKAAKQVVTYCIRNDIGTLIVGYNTTFQRSSDLGRQMNQVFVGISFGILRRKLKYLCEMNGIRYVEQEESYTSMASFWDLDEMPVYGEAGLVPPVFSGRRICRGLYQDRSGRRINADVNGALNIMRKCNIVSLRALYDRGDVDTPVRIRIA
jgi:IS605 OrfB family transposase